VAQEAGPVETRSYARFDVLLANSDHRLLLDTQQQRVRYGENITISGSASGGREASIWQGNRKLESVPVQAGRWRLRVASQSLGVGPVSLGVRVVFGDDTVVRSAPLKVEIMPPESAGKAPGNYHGNAEKIAPAGSASDHKAFNTVRLRGRLRGLPAAQYYIMTGQFVVADAGFFELVVSGTGKVSLAVDAGPLLSGQVMDREQTRYFPLALQQGAHDLKIEYSPADKEPYLHVMLEGDQPATIPEVEVIGVVHKQSTVMP